MTDRIRNAHEDPPVGPRSSEATAGKAEEGGDSTERIVDRRELSRTPPQPTEARAGPHARSEKDRPCIFVRLPSQTRFLALERALVREICELAGFEAEQIDRIVLAVDEACTNIIRHGYGGACDQPIEISAEPLADADGGILLRIRDYGRQFDPEALVPRDVGEVRPGGLGVHIIHQVMDSVQYSRADGGGMQLTLTKKRGTPPRP